jgi:hypothetical protein
LFFLLMTSHATPFSLQPCVHISLKYSHSPHLDTQFSYNTSMLK